MICDLLCPITLHSCRCKAFMSEPNYNTEIRYLHTTDVANLATSIPVGYLVGHLIIHLLLYFLSFSFSSRTT
jgi:hypothetical protein